MPKISINDRSPNGIALEIKVINSLFNGARKAIDRLGSDADTLEVIIISPNNFETYKTPPYINVKIVIANNGESLRSQAKVERSFDLFCDESTGEQFLAQRVIWNFRDMLVELSDQLDKRAEQLRNVLTRLTLREEQTGNCQRCHICGYMFPTPEKGECPECAKCHV